MTGKLFTDSWPELSFRLKAVFHAIQKLKAGKLRYIQVEQLVIQLLSLSLCSRNCRFQFYAVIEKWTASRFVAWRLY